MVVGITMEGSVLGSQNGEGREGGVDRDGIGGVWEGLNMRIKLAVLYDLRGLKLLGMVGGMGV